MTKIYEEDGPRWTDSDGEAQSGWPRDGFLLELHRLGDDRYELQTTRRHIDGDGESSDTEAMSAEEAAAWLRGRTPVPGAVLKRYFGA